MRIIVTGNRYSRHALWTFFFPRIASVELTKYVYLPLKHPFPAAKNIKEMIHHTTANRIDLKHHQLKQTTDYMYCNFNEFNETYVATVRMLANL
jgi:hypothetical protein